LAARNDGTLATLGMFRPLVSCVATELVSVVYMREWAASERSRASQRLESGRRRVEIGVGGWVV
jgi:hypothetical protein